MKKSLIALAVASVFIAPAAWAQISVTGKAHVSFDMHDSGLPGAATHTSLTSTGSRLTFGAGEKLSDDLSVGIGIDTTIAMDTTQAALLGDRGVGVSLISKSMGTLNAGSGASPLKAVTRGMDLFDGTVGTNDKMMANRTSTTTNSIFNSNAPNGIGYTSPSIMGFSVTVGKILTESTASVDGPLALLARYKAGPADVFITQITRPVGAIEKQIIRSGGGTYSMGPLAAVVIYETNANTSSNSIKTTWNGTYLGAKYNISKTDAIKVAYTTIGDSTVGGVPAINGDKQIVAGYDHNLSKDTKVYALASSLKNNAAGAPNKTIYSLGLMKNF